MQGVQGSRACRGTWRTFDAIHGLQGGVRHLVHDASGHLWIGSRGAGLYRFDGREFLNYTRQHGLVHMAVECILPDGEGGIWLATLGGVSHFDGRRFRNLTPNDGLPHGFVWSLCPDGEGGLWCGTNGGLARIQRGRIAQTITVADGLPNPVVGPVCRDAAGQIWAGTNAGLIRLAEGRIQNWTTRDGLPSNVVGRVFIDSKGAVWCGTPHGAARFDGGTFTVFHKEHGLPADFIARFFEDRQGRLWIGTWRNGVACFDGERFTNYTVEDGLADVGVGAITQSPDDVYFFGIDTGGLTVFDPHSIELCWDMPVLGPMHRDDTGTFWAARDTTLLRLGDGATDAMEMPGRIGAIGRPPDGSLWVGTHCGLYRVEEPPEAEPLTAPPRRIFQDAGIGPVRGMCRTRDGRMVLGSADGPALWIIDGDCVETVQTHHQGIETIFEDRAGRIWLGGFHDGGLSCFRGAKVTHYYEGETFPWHGTAQIIEDAAGILWLATFRGLLRCHVNATPLQIENLPGINLSCACAAVAEDGSVWVGTLGGGVYRFAGDVVQTLTADDGLPSNNVTALLPQADGTVLIATSRGIVRYTATATGAPHVYIDEVIVDRAYLPGEEIVVPAPRASMITVAFHAAATTTRRVRYRYRVLGLETTWTSTWDAEARFGPLGMGDYVFEVEAYSRDLARSAAPAQVAFCIVADPVTRAFEDRIGEMERQLEVQQRLTAQNAVLVQLARSSALERGDLVAAVRAIDAAAGDTLGVQWVNAARLSADGAVLESIDEYQRDTTSHRSGLVFPAAHFQTLIQAMERNRVAAVEDVTQSPITAPFAAQYLTPDGITSLLAASIRRGGHVVGFVAFLPVGPPRTWLPEEEQFAGAIADLVSLAIEASERRAAEQALLEYRTHLEELVEARTRDLATAQGQLVRAEKLAALGELIAMVGHELRNPLGTIRTSLYTIDRMVRSRLPAASRALDRAERNIARCDRIIQELLDYSRSPHLVPMTTEIDVWVRQAMADIEVPTGIRFELALHAPGVKLEVDRERLFQCLSNLVTNAYQALQSQDSHNDDGAAAEGCVTVATGTDRGRFLLQVIDTGPGIDPEVRPRVFDPLFTTRVFGIGLGLPIVRQVVELHGGEVEILDPPQGGTAVCIRLPIPRHAAAATVLSSTNP